MKKLFICLITTLLLMSCSSENRYILNRSINKELPVYNEESENAIVIGTIGCGQKVTLISEGWNEWHKIEFNGGTGYIHDGDYSIVDENGDLIWITKSLIKGLGYFIGIILLIGIAIALISVIIAGIAFIFGLIMKVIVYIVIGAGLGWLFGYAISNDTNTTFTWITIGTVIGIIIGIIRIVKNPISASNEGLKAVSDAYKDARNKELERETQERKDFPYELSDGTKVRKDIDGNWIDKEGNKYPNQFN